MVPQTLFHIREEHINLIQLLEENDGELTPELEQSLALTQEAFQEKAISYGFIVKSFDHSEAIIDSELKRLKDLKEKAAKRSELFKERLSGAMQQFGVEKIETPTLKLSFRKSEAVEIIEEGQLPVTMLDVVPQTYKVNKTKIKEAIKAGQEVPGASLVSRLNLQIK